MWLINDIKIFQNQSLHFVHILFSQTITNVGHCLRLLAFFDVAKHTKTRSASFHFVIKGQVKLFVVSLLNVHVHLASVISENCLNSKRVPKEYN